MSKANEPDAFVLAAMMERADVRDRLIGGGSIEDLPQGARVGTLQSPRRAAQLLNLRPDLNILPFAAMSRPGSTRSRLETQMRHYLRQRGSIDSGSRREAPFQLTSCFRHLDKRHSIESRADDARVRALDRADQRSADLRGGRAGAGIYATPAAVATRRLLHSEIAEGDVFRLHAQLLSEDGADSILDSALVENESGAILFAEAMLERASPAIRMLFEGQ